MKVVVKYCGYYAGTSAWSALGDYDSLEETQDDAYAWACDQHSQWEQDEADCEEDSYFWQSVDYEIFEYDPEKHDMNRAGGGSFADDFKD